MTRSSTSETSVCDLLLLDVCPLGLGIEDIHGNMHTLIRRNTVIPARTELYPIFTNAYAYQTTATIRIFKGEHNLTKYNILLGEFSLSDLTSNFAAQTLEIAIRMDIDANGILHVDAEEARSGAKASFTVGSNQQRLSKDDIERHITYVESDTNFAAKSVYDRKPNDPLYLLDGQITAVTRNFSGELITSFGQTTGAPLLIKLKNVRSSRTMIEELIKLQSEDGSFTLNKDLADILHINVDIFNGLEQYLREQGFNSLALNIQNEILRLIGTGVILLWLVLQMQDLQQNTCQFLFNIEQIKVYLCNHLPANMNEQISKAIEFYQQISQRNGIYCKQLELSDSSWDMFIQLSTQLYQKSINWDNRAQGQYTDAMAKADFGSVSGWKNDRASISDGKLRITLRKNALGGESGIISNTRIPDGSAYELDFDVRFHSQFDWSRGGKVGFGFGIGNRNTGCNPPKDGAGGTLRLMWYNDNKRVYFIPYVYYYGMPGQCGDKFGKSYPSTGMSSYS
ncbi:unnamed protein product [Rotaria sordida]|uniref:PARP4 MVP-ID C-terminal domain-containing protein n=1 Tax=Rotaria sordida TaxID=392033 RepID=A0A819KAP9_9BILA|nr:unnamed protein product [Rotaria sordida]